MCRILVYIESFVLGFMALFIMDLGYNHSTFESLIVALIVGFVFPILIRKFKPLALIAAVAFSFSWSILAYNIVTSVANNSAIVGLLCGLGVFAISYVLHKKYSRLMIQDVRENNNDQQAQMTTHEITHETVTFCPKCGRRIHSIDGRCDFCNR